MLAGVWKYIYFPFLNKEMKINYQLVDPEDNKILQGTLNFVFIGIFCWQVLHDCLRQLLWDGGMVDDIRRTKLVSLTEIEGTLGLTSKDFMEID